MLTLLAHQGRSPVARLVVVAVGAHLPYLAALLLLWRRGGASRWSVLAVALALRAITVAAPPTFSDDIYRYVWDGRVGLAGLNPFSHAPDDPALVQLRDAGWERVNHRELRTIYPPASQLWFMATTAVSPTPTAFKVLAALADIGVVWLVILLARRRSRAGPATAGLALPATVAGAAYGWNPLVCIETGMSGHLEPLAVLPLLIAVWLASAAGASGGAGGAIGWRRGVGAGVGLGLAAGTKLLPLLLLPVVGRRVRWSWLVAPLLLGALYLPFLGAGAQLVETLDTFARRWEGNGSLFAVVRGGAEGLFGWLGGGGKDDLIHLPFLDGLAAALQDGFFSLHKDGGFDPVRPGAWPATDLALAAAKIVSGAVVLATLGYCVFRRVNPLTAACWVLGALVIALPVAHPWYLLWVLPFAAARGGWPWLWLTATMPLAYLPLEGWWSAGRWDAPAWIQLVEYIPFFALLGLLAWRRRRSPGDEEGARRSADRSEAVDPPPRSK
jgi:hypothetical protein